MPRQSLQVVKFIVPGAWGFSVWGQKVEADVSFNDQLSMFGFKGY